MERAFLDAGFPEGAFTNLFVSFDQVDGMISDPRIKGVTLTGSERAGSTVAELAGKHLKKVVLELGGSDPLIVLDDAPMDVTAANAAFGRMLNAGQSCVASKRLIVVGKERGAEFVENLVAEVQKYEPADPTDPDTNFGPVPRPSCRRRGGGYLQPFWTDRTAQVDSAIRRDHAGWKFDRGSPMADRG